MFRVRAPSSIYCTVRGTLETSSASNSRGRRSAAREGQGSERTSQCLEACRGPHKYHRQKGEIGCHFRKLKAGEGSFQSNSRQHAIKNGSITRSLLYGERGGPGVHSSTDSHRGTTVDAAGRQAL